MSDHSGSVNPTFIVIALIFSLSSQFFLWSLSCLFFLLWLLLEAVLCLYFFLLTYFLLPAVHREREGTSPLLLFLETMAF